MYLGPPPACNPYVKLQKSDKKIPEKQVIKIKKKSNKTSNTKKKYKKENDQVIARGIE